MKVAPLYHALAIERWRAVDIVHTGQHYDGATMSDAFFRDLHLPDPAHHLEVGSGTHAEQTGRTMIAYEKVAEQTRPDWIVVVGDEKKRLEEFGLIDDLSRAPAIRVTEPLSYVEFMISFRAARSRSYPGIPCATLRENTERPITISERTNRLLAARELSRTRRRKSRAAFRHRALNN